MNAIANIAQTLTGSPFTASKKTPTLAQCKAEMTKQVAATQKGIASTFQAAIALGEAASIAKDLCGHGKWVAWLKENFETKYTWVNVCMRAAAAWHLLEKQPEAQRLAVLEKFDTVEKFAGTLTVLDQGENPVEVAPVPRTRAPNKLKRDNRLIDVESRDIPDTGAGANAAAETIKALDARSLALDKREQALNVREAKLDDRERALALREAKPAAAMGLKPDESIEALKAKALAQSEKATRSPAPAATTAAKPKAKGSPAPDAKTAQKPVRAKPPGRAALLQAEKDAIQQRAQEAAANVKAQATEEPASAQAPAAGPVAGPEASPEGPF